MLIWLFVEGKSKVGNALLYTAGPPIVGPSNLAINIC